MKFIKKKIKGLFDWVLSGVVGLGIGLVLSYVLTIPCFVNFGHPVMQYITGTVVEERSIVDYAKDTYSLCKDSVYSLVNKDKSSQKGFEVITIQADINYDATLSKNHYYNLLNDNSKEIYIELYKAAQELNSDIKIKGNFTKEEINTAITYFNYDYPEYFFLDLHNCNLVMYYHSLNKGKNLYSYFTLKYNGIASNLEYEYYKNKFIGEEILKNIDNKTEKEGIRYIHDYIVKHVDYDKESENNQDIRSSMQNGKTVCAGYAKMFKYLCDEAGYDCIYVVGEADGSDGTGYHAWNKVKIDDKEYSIDVTWDDTTNSNNYFLISNEKMSINHYVDETLVVLCSN